MNKKIMLSKEAVFLLSNLCAQTHPNLDFRAWVEDPGRDTTRATQEMLDAGYLQEINGILSPTTAGINYSRPQPNQDATDLIRQIKMALPRNPKFDVIVRNLTDTALMGLIYECLGEIGRRGDPGNPEVVKYWQGKIENLQVVLDKATPDTLYERHNAQMESFGEFKKVKTKAKA